MYAGPAKLYFEGYLNEQQFKHVSGQGLTLFFSRVEEIRGRRPRRAVGNDGCQRVSYYAVPPARTRTGSVHQFSRSRSACSDVTTCLPRHIVRVQAILPGASTYCCCW